MRHRIARALCGIIGAATILAGVGFASAAPPSSPQAEDVKVEDLRILSGPSEGDQVHEIDTSTGQPVSLTLSAHLTGLSGIPEGKEIKLSATSRCAKGDTSCPTQLNDMNPSTDVRAVDGTVIFHVKRAGYGDNRDVVLVTTKDTGRYTDAHVTMRMQGYIGNWALVDGFDKPHEYYVSYNHGAEWHIHVKPSRWAENMEEGIFQFSADGIKGGIGSSLTMRDGGLLNVAAHENQEYRGEKLDLKDPRLAWIPAEWEHVSPRTPATIQVTPSYTGTYSMYYVHDGLMVINDTMRTFVAQHEPAAHAEETGEDISSPESAAKALRGRAMTFLYRSDGQGGWYIARSAMSLRYDRTQKGQNARIQWGGATEAQQDGADRYYAALRDKGLNPIPVNDMLPYQINFTTNPDISQTAVYDTATFWLDGTERMVRGEADVHPGDTSKPLLTTNQYKVTHHSASVGNSADGKLAVLLSYMPAHGATCAVSPARLNPGDRTTIASSGCGLRGYRLLGWSTTPDATAPDGRFAPGGQYTMPDHNVTLYPVLATLPPTISTESRTVTRTIHITPDSLHAEDVKQTVTLTRRASTDAATGRKTYGDWTEGVWDSRQAPEYDGWVPRVKSVPLAHVTGGTADTTVTLPYDPTVRFESEAKTDRPLPESQAPEYGTAASEPSGDWRKGSTTVRKGWVFQGWTGPDGKPYDFSQPVGRPLVLTAAWKAIGSPRAADKPSTPQRTQDRPAASSSARKRTAPQLAHTGADATGMLIAAVLLLAAGIAIAVPAVRHAVRRSRRP